MEHGDDCNLIGCVIDFVNNDLGQADDNPFQGSPRAANMPHIREYSKAIGSIANAGDNLGRRPFIPLINVFVDVFDIELCPPTISNSHRPHFFQRAAISSSVA